MNRKKKQRFFIGTRKDLTLNFDTRLQIKLFFVKRHAIKPKKNILLTQIAPTIYMYVNVCAIYCPNKTMVFRSARL